MQQDLQNKLFEKYPKIFVQKDLTIYESCMPWGIDCGDGWYTLIDQLCSQIQYYIKNQRNWCVGEAKTEIIFEATQVKEKFGGLRFYYIGGNGYIEGLTDMAEAMSYHICDVCGAEGKRDSKGLCATRCDKHNK